MPSSRMGKVLPTSSVEAVQNGIIDRRCFAESARRPQLHRCYSEPGRRISISGLLCRAPYAYETNELLKIFDGFRILKYEDVVRVHE